MADTNQIQQDKVLSARLTDAARLCGPGRPCFVGFLDLHQQAIAEQLMPKLCRPGCHVLLDGGFPQAERRVAGFFDDEDTPRFPFVVLRIRYDARFNSLSHRDFLGALMGLGIKRDLVGDIAVADGEATVVVLGEIAPYVCEHLKMVGRAGVSIETTGDFCYNNEDNVKYGRVSVASDRIDAVLAAVTRLSREKAVKLVYEERVRLNHQTITEKSHPVVGTELLSVAGRGRWQLVGYSGTSKKGRLFLEFKEFM